MIRQLMTGLYKQATKLYMKKLNERNGIRAELSRITGETFAESFDEQLALRLNMGDLMKDYIQNM